MSKRQAAAAQGNILMSMEDVNEMAAVAKNDGQYVDVSAMLNTIQPNGPAAADQAATVTTGAAAAAAPAGGVGVAGLGGVSAAQPAAQGVTLGSLTGGLKRRGLSGRRMVAAY